jgi:hypothetical protein
MQDWRCLMLAGAIACARADAAAPGLVSVVGVDAAGAWNGAIAALERRFAVSFGLDGAQFPTRRRALAALGALRREQNDRERGVVLGGVSAGSICWHVGGPTDSFGPKLETVTNGLALLPYGNGVHYDTEAQRRPLLHSLVSNGTLPLSYATDDHAAVIYEGTNPVEVVVDTSDSKAKAYRVETISGEVNETVLEPGSLA